ncbi:MAG: UDP-2,3-diacylglucosamine diphosphatase LpxI [Candidatus Omnitrophica bacterium]|nr:UDP-2,3-diacylglucosamine diphosphatase LpxI [Candidatus Omnitrophota bacterium]
MKKIGLIAGKGTLPSEFLRSAKARGEKVVVFALQGMASPELEKEADKIYWIGIGQYKKFLFLFLKERIRKLILLGKVEKSTIYQNENHDAQMKKALKGLKNKKDYSILRELTRRLGTIGIEVIDASGHLSHLLPSKGVITKTKINKAVEEDISFGYDIAKKIAGMDVGQTIIVKNKTVVAVEAMEGTDATVERATKIAGEGCVMIKVSRPDQDPRWDVPTVGINTIKKLAENKFSALAIESGKMFLLDKEDFLSLADAFGIVVKII